MSYHYFPKAQRELWQLIEQRSSGEVPPEDVDRLIWERFADEGAILVSDLAGFTRRTIELGITHFLETILRSHELLRPVIDQHDGIVFEAVGDNMLIWFKRVDQAVQCSVAMQRTCEQFNRNREPRDQVLLCLGMGYGRVLRIGSSRLAGGELNAASKLGEDLAEAYEILVTQSFQRAARKSPNIDFVLTGESLPGSEEVYRMEYRTLAEEMSAAG